jgi:hypothetical protein
MYERNPQRSSQSLPTMHNHAPIVFPQLNPPDGTIVVIDMRRWCRSRQSFLHVSFTTFPIARSRHIKVADHKHRCIRVYTPHYVFLLTSLK